MILFFWFVQSRGTSPTPSVLGDGRLTAAERRARKALEYEEEEGEAQPSFVREAEVPVPNIPLPRGSGGNVGKIIFVSFSPFYFFSFFALGIHFA